MKLVLFDIDGTLITDGGAARAAYASALRANPSRGSRRSIVVSSSPLRFGRDPP
jgi:hydroxymethylpyrimidine pyrophosphatase-like HAD family hydrolase